MGISADRILSKLDEYLNKKDNESAERHLLYWLAEANNTKDHRTEILVRNELMGLLRKLGREEDAVAMAETTLKRTEELRLGESVGTATTYLNCATVFKAFGMAERALPLYEKSRVIYERELDPADGRLGGLYNNTALALVDLKRFSQADELYKKAVSVMEKQDSGDLEVAMTYLNMATAAEAEHGLEASEKAVSNYLETAWSILDAHQNWDGYYAFVCEKCATVYGYYGYFLYEGELNERSRRIYEGA